VDIRQSMLLALLCTVDREQSHVLAVKIRGAEELGGPSAGAASPYRLTRVTEYHDRQLRASATSICRDTKALLSKLSYSRSPASRR
jgi:hypothetical protein